MHKKSFDTTTKNNLKEYAKEALRYNKVHNLFARASLDDVLIKDIEDCIPATNYIEKNHKVLDVGSGAGFPGAVMGIVQPGASITLAESNKKKTYFLKKTAKKLSLKNIKVAEERITKNTKLEKFDIITARAFSETAKIINDCDHLLKSGGLYVLLKGKRNKIEEEIKSINKKDHNCEIIKQENEEQERHILLITKIN